MLAEEAFRKKWIDGHSLEKAGFTMHGHEWVLSKEIIPDLFRADLRVSQEGNASSQGISGSPGVSGGLSISGTVIDLETGDPYLLLEVENASGTFTGTVRRAYTDFLEETADMFRDLPFESAQANRIASRAASEFGVLPEMAFKKTEGNVFRNPSNGRWFAAVFKVKASVLQKPESSKTNSKPELQNPDAYVEVMNVKIDPESLDSLLKERGIYPAWHMNKKNWITLALDDSLDDSRILSIMRRSYALTDGSSSAAKRSAQVAPSAWVIPSKPSRYDVAKGFSDSPDGIIPWHQRIHVKPGDEVFIYQAAPVAAITFRTIAVETDIPDIPDNPSGSSGILNMRLKLAETYPKDLWPRAFLNKHGIKVTVRGQRSMPKELYDLIKNREKDSER
ncbi:MAG: MmcQ/YjbR family DNA-binding protein [Eubacteriales bacterium]|nr:MmcQ/YjbR family DNA-binding protein [Eubacteriales bacterium]